MASGAVSMKSATVSSVGVATQSPRIRSHYRSPVAAGEPGDARAARSPSRPTPRSPVPAARRTPYARVVAVQDDVLNRVTWKIPNALVLVGSAAGGERNAMTASWVTQLAMEPVLVGVGIDCASVTHRLIAQGGSFSVNLWSAEDTRVFVKFSKPASDDGEALNGRPVRSATTGAPVFAEAVAWMDCVVRQAVELGTHTLFIGEVVDAAVLDDEVRAAGTTDTRMKYGGVKRH